MYSNREGEAEDSLIKMGKTNSKNTVEVKCYQCQESLQPCFDSKHVKREFYNGKETEVFLDGAYYRFVGDPNGSLCPSCFWKTFMDDYQENDEIHGFSAQLKWQKKLVDNTGNDQAESNLSVGQNAVNELHKQASEWIEKEQFATLNTATKHGDIEDSYIPKSSKTFNNFESYTPQVEDEGEEDYDEEISGFSNNSNFEISKENVLRLVYHTTQRNSRAESVLNELKKQKPDDLLTIFNEILFVDKTKDLILQPNIKMLKWIQLFLVNLLITKWIEKSNVIYDRSTSFSHLRSSLANILYNLQEVVEDRDECVQLTRSLFLISIHPQFYSDGELDDNSELWQCEKYDDYRTLTVKVLNALIRAPAGVLNYNTHKRPSFWNWADRAFELLIRTYSDTVHDYQTLLTRLVRSGALYPDELVESLPIVLQKLDANDVYLPRVLEYLASYRLPSENMFGKHQSFSEALRGKKQSDELLQIIKNKVQSESDKTLNELNDEMSEYDMASSEDLKLLKCLVYAALNKLVHYGHPQMLHGYQARMFLDWANIIRSRRHLSNEHDLVDSLVTLCCAVKHVKGYWPRLTQMISWCLLVTAKPFKGRLLQIRTGEGKSCVIAMVAATFACLKNTADIITSSPILAIRDTKEWLEFFSLFGISASNNVNNDNDEQRLRCYKSPVVYGTVSLFASDILRQEFQLKNVRGERKLNVVIVDEVDVMLLDQGVQFTYLSDSYAGLRHLQPILAMVWKAVSQYRPACTQTGEIFYTGIVRPFYYAVCDVLASSSSHIDHMQLIEIGESEEIFEKGFKDKVTAAEQSLEHLSSVLSNVSKESVIALLLKLREYVPQHFLPYTLNSEGILNPTIDPELNGYLDVSVVPILVAENGTCMVLHSDDVFLKQMIVDNLKAHISSCDKSNDVINVHDSIFDFVQNKLTIWVENAFKAITMIEGREYIVKEENIVPIDYMCTGVIETNKKWSDGLQQFLEMKHRLAVSDISLVTNFMSNISFFQRYNACIFGVTGTLGSDVDQEFIRKHFGVDLCSVPTSLTRKLYEYDGLVCHNDSDWVNQVCISVESEIKKTTRGKLGRAALVICEDIKKANVVYEAVKQRVTNKVLLYTRSDTNTSHEMNNKFTLGQVIVATNLAGRGTDINLTRQICESGGLFVLVTFLPINRRVEEQAFGRAGRKGQPGTAQIILNASHLPLTLRHLQSLKQIKNQREQRYRRFMDAMEGGEVKECLLKQSLFQLYCDAISHVHDMTFCNDSERNIMLNSLHEFWGMWLQMHAQMITELRKNDLIFKLNMDLNTALNKASKRQSPTQNVYHIINYANNRLSLQQYDKAIQLYSAAIETNGNFSSIAHYNKAYCIINTAGKNYFQNAMTELDLAQRKLNEYIDEAVLIKQFVELSGGVENLSLNSGIDTQSSLSTKQSNNDTGVPGELDVDNPHTSSLSRCIESRIQLFNSIRENIQESMENLKRLKIRKHKAGTEVTSIFKLVSEDEDVMQKELYDAWKHGLTFTFSIKKRYQFCWEGFVVTVLGVAQVVAGVIVLAITMGPLFNVGVGLIMEGVSDIIAGLCGMHSGDFSMVTWASSKAVSVATSIVTFGAAQLASKGVAPCIAGAKEALNELKMIPSVLSGGLRSAGEKTITAVMKENAKHAAKHAVRVFIEKSATKGLNYLQRTFIEELTYRTSDALHSKIKRNISDTFKSSYIKHQIDRLISHALNMHQTASPDEEQLLDIIRKFANEVVDPVVSAQDVKPILSKIMNLLKMATNIGEKNEDGSFTEKLITNVPLICDLLYGGWKICNLCCTFNETLGDKISKFCDEKASGECDEQDINELRYDAFYKRVQNEIARILSWAIANIFVQHIASHGIQKVRKSINDAVGDAKKRYLPTSETLRKLILAKNQTAFTRSPSDNAANNKSNRLINKYVEQNLNEASMGTILHCKILCRLLGKNIEVYENTKKGLRKSAVSIAQSSTENPVKIVFHKPQPGYPEGFYDVMNTSSSDSCMTRERKSLFLAVTQCLHPAETSEFHHNYSKKLKEDIIGELYNHFSRWQDLIDFTQWARWV